MPPRLEQVVETLGRVREEYIATFRHVVQQRRSNGERLVPELLLELDNPTGLAENLYRIDLAVEDGNPALVDLNMSASSAIAWDACPVEFEAETDYWPDVLGWFRRWVDIEDQNPTDEDGLSGVVHSMTQPERVGSRINVSVDFGSAPLEACLALVDVLKQSGGRHITVGQLHLDEA